MPLRDEARDKVGCDDTALRMGRKEDSISSSEVIDPGGVGQVCFVQSTEIRQEKKHDTRRTHLSTR